MKKKGRKILLIIIVVVLILMIPVGIIGWKKRIGIYNTFMKLTGQESSFEVIEKLRSDYTGYYKQKLKVKMDRDNTIKIQENDQSADDVETTITKEATLVASSLEIDQQLQTEQENGYTWEEPMVISNPYQISPLTAVVLFDTEDSCGVRFTVKGKTEAADISGEVAAATSHRVPIIGLYPGMENTVVLELLDSQGKTTDSQEIKITTDALPENMQDVVTPVQTSGESAFELTMVYGQRTHYPFAYDCMGDIRWYMSRETANYGVFMLSNHRMIWQDPAGYVPSVHKPQTTNMYEMDYLGRAYRMYYVSGGVHHEVIEKEPGGNLLVLSSSMKAHVEDVIQEIDRESGEVVDELNLKDIFGDKFADRFDWAHLNTVSYQPEEGTILVNARNIESSVKIDWATKEIKWILCDPYFWKGSEFEKYVLTPDGDFTYHYQPHSVYQLSADLDGNPDTVEISMFDNHYLWNHKSELPSYEATGNSYILVYSVDEKNGTVKQLKSIPTAFSNITSNAVYDEESNHIFSMSGHIKTTGKTFEYDYDTGEVLNEFDIATSFYRASEMLIDYNDLATPMEVENDYIKGELWQPVSTNKKINSAPSETISSDKVSLKMMGKTLYVGTDDHRISQVIFQGENNTYVYDLSDIRLYLKVVMQFHETIPIPLQGMETDTYNIYVMYEDNFYNTDQSFTIK